MATQDHKATSIKNRKPQSKRQDKEITDDLLQEKTGNRTESGDREQDCPDPKKPMKKVGGWRGLFTDTPDF